MPGETEAQGQRILHTMPGEHKAADEQVEGTGCGGETTIPVC